MASIPLIRASQLEPFAQALRASGARDTGLLERSGVRPYLPVEAPDTLVPEYAVWDFVERAARQSGDDSFGWQIGLETPIERIGAFGQDIGSAATLRGVLRLFLHAVTKHSSHARFSVKVRGEQVWFCRHGIDQIDVGSWHVEQYVLGMMVRLVRLALERDWIPAVVLLKQRTLSGRPMPAELRSADVHLGSDVTAFPIPQSVLDRPLAQGTQAPAALSPIECDFAASLRWALRAGLGNDWASLEQTARFAGVAPRTLQRKLRREGGSFARVLEEVRSGEARRLLAMPQSRVTEVATQLGYADPANFTRAFRRWTGTTPSRFREDPTG